MAMNQITPLETILGSGAGGPLTPPTAWNQLGTYVQYGGGVVVGTPVGGYIGPGIINCLDLYINNTKFDTLTVLMLTGGTLTGPLIQAADPVNALGTATKQYVDAAKASAGIGTFVPLAGGTLTGPLIQAADPVSNLGTATKQYVDAAKGSAGVGTFLPLTGGTMTGNLVLNASPTAPLGAATKGYVDGAISGAGTGVFLPLTGGTVTGFITLNADPTNTLHAATKNYVDTHTISPDAPNDGQYYSRRNLGWAVTPGGLSDAPSDGSTYGRLNGAWSNVIDAGTF
jgi:hypothetical protein